MKFSVFIRYAEDVADNHGTLRIPMEDSPLPQPAIVLDYLMQHDLAGQQLDTATVCTVLRYCGIPPYAPWEEWCDVVGRALTVLLVYSH